VWTAEGITINGEPSGEVVDAEFVSADRGYLLAADCHLDWCTLTFGATEDGGRTWLTSPAPGDFAKVRPDAVPALVTLGNQVTVTSNTSRRESLVRDVSDDGGSHWTEERGTWEGALPVVELPVHARPVAVLGDHGCAGEVYVWVPRPSTRTDAAAGLDVLANQPPINVCWAASTPAPDGAWWVAGVEGGTQPGQGRAAVAVSRDNGRTWTPTVLDQPGASGARVATLGRLVYVATLAARGSTDANRDALTAVYASDDLGRSFTRHTHTGAPSTLAGDLVPLLDGRLLLVDANGQWYVSGNAGTSWLAAVGLHPTGRVARTAAGYVAYKLTKVYTAFSVDGSTWRKLSVV
jgi:hypothetical protein